MPCLKKIAKIDVTEICNISANEISSRKKLDNDPTMAKAAAQTVFDFNILLFIYKEGRELHRSPAFAVSGFLARLLAALTGIAISGVTESELSVCCSKYVITFWASARHRSCTSADTPA
jgi:hypothetical protein